MRIKAIFFDYGGTLDADGIPWKEHFQTIYESAGVRVEQEKFDRAFYDADDSLTDEGLDQTSFAETLREQVGRVLKSLGKSNASLQETIADTFRQNTIRKIEENRVALNQLKKRFKLGIISNFYGNLPTICEELGLLPLFDVIVDSKRVGNIKPSPQIFNHALSAVGVSAAQALMVGDSPKRDMLGAKSMGMPHILLSRQPANTCCPGDIVIREIPDLLGILQKYE